MDSSIAERSGGIVSGLAQLAFFGAVFAALFVGEKRLLTGVQGASVLAGISSCFLSVGLAGVVGFIWRLLVPGEDSFAALLRRARTGVPPADGERMIATGRVRPLGPPLIAPFSGRACVAYEYRIGWNWRDAEGSLPDYWGSASRPFALQAPTSIVQVHAVSILERTIAPEQQTGSEAVDRARRWIATTRFESVGGSLGD